MGGLGFGHGEIGAQAFVKGFTGMQNGGFGAGWCGVGWTVMAQVFGEGGADVLQFEGSFKRQMAATIIISERAKQRRTRDVLQAPNCVDAKTVGLDELQIGCQIHQQLVVVSHMNHTQQQFSQCIVAVR